MIAAAPAETAPGAYLTFAVALSISRTRRRTENQAREADLPTQQAGAQAPSWLSQPPEDQGGPQGAGCPAAAWAQAAQRLKPARRSASSPMQRLRQRADFLAAASGPRAPVSGFVLQALNRHENGPVRVGFTVSKKVGNSVERNRVRRRLREVVRLSAQRDDMQGGYDYVLIGRRAALELPFERLVEDFGHALRRVHGGKGALASPHGSTRQSSRT